MCPRNGSIFVRAGFKISVKIFSKNVTPLLPFSESEKTNMASLNYFPTKHESHSSIQ